MLVSVVGHDDPQGKLPCQSCLSCQIAIEEPIDSCAANEPPPQSVVGGRQRVAAGARVHLKRRDQ